MSQESRIAKIKKNTIEYTFECITEVPFDYSLEITCDQDRPSCITFRQEEERSLMGMVIQSLQDWDVFLRNELFLGLLSLSSSITLKEGVASVRKEIEEVFEGLDIALKWERKLGDLGASISRVIVFKDDLLMMKDLYLKDKLNIWRMAEVKSQNALKYVSRLGLMTLTDTKHSQGLNATLNRLSSIWKETSAEDRFRSDFPSRKFEDIERQLREIIINNRSIESDTQRGNAEDMYEFLEEQFQEIDTRIEKRELNLTKFGHQMTGFINTVAETYENREKVTALVSFVFEKLIKFFKLKPEEVCWSGLPTVRESPSERSSVSRDYEDTNQEKQELRNTIASLQKQVDKYKTEVETLIKAKSTATVTASLRPSLTKCATFSKEPPKCGVNGKQKLRLKQKERENEREKREKNKQRQKIVRFKTGASSRSSLLSTSSVTINKSMTNLNDKSKLTIKKAAIMDNPVPLLQKKMNRIINTPSGVSTPKTTPSKPKLDSANKIPETAKNYLKLIDRQSVRQFK